MKKNKQLDNALEEFEALVEFQYEVASDTLDAQNAETRAVIQKIGTTLKQYGRSEATFLLDGDSYSVPISDDLFNKSIVYLAVEIAKDLALVDIKVAAFSFPSEWCAICGVTV